MSAYMVSKRHIDLLVSTAFYGPSDAQKNLYTGRWYRPNFKGFSQWSLEEMNAVGEMLVKENLSSIHARYPDTLTNPDNTPGPCEQYWLEPYELTDKIGRNRLTIVQALKAISCYEYQSCEHPEWENSDAYKFCQSFTHSLISCLPGYEDAKWEIAA